MQEKQEQKQQTNIIVETRNSQPYLRMNSGRFIPMVGYGSYNCGDKDYIIKILYEAIVKIGYRHIDTASYYKNEEAIGQALEKIFKQTSIKRQDIFITSKFWHHQKFDVQKALKTSLQKLKLDYLDLYLVHWPIPPFADENPKLNEQQKKSIPKHRVAKISTHYVWKQLQGFVKQGLIKDIGVSNFNYQLLTEVWAGGEIEPAMNQIELNPYLQQRQLVDYSQNCLNVQVTAYRPVACAGNHKNYKKHVLGDDKVIQQIGLKHKKTPYQIALRWGIQRGHVMIPMTSNMDRLKENFQIVSFKLDNQDMEKIAALDQNFRGCDTKGRPDIFRDVPVFQ